MIVKTTDSTVRVKTAGSKFTKVILGSLAAKMHLVYVSSSDETAGSTTGSGRYKEGSVVQIEAIANPGYIFSHWSDGSTERVRQLEVENDIELVAYFKEDISLGILTYVPNTNTLNPNHPQD